MSIPIQFKKLSSFAKLPTKAHPSDAGFDVVASESITVPPHSRVKVPLGFAVAIPSGYCLIAKERSGLALKNSIDIHGGVIDESYRGEVCAIVANSSDVEFKIDIGTKITQMLLIPVPVAHFVEVDSLTETERGTGGFGSSGL
jgi:dUTP pyrophosphatase